MTTIDNEDLILNIVPVAFSRESIWIGQTPYIDDAGYRSLRELHWRTHAFRFDNRFDVIENIPVVASADPLGTAVEVPLREHLSLTARAVQHATLVWIAGRVPIQRSGKQLTFWGQAERTRLLSQVLNRLRLAPAEGLEVSLRYTLDCRTFADQDGERFLGLTIGVNTSNRIEIPVAELHRRGMDLIGREVCRRRQFEHDYLQPGLEALGRVVAEEGRYLRLVDAIDVELVEADTVMLRPTLWNLNDVITSYFGQRAGRVLRELNAQRQRIASADGKLEEIRTTLEGLKRRQLVIGREVEVHLGELLTSADARFPRPITTPPPTLLFGPQGRNTELYADLGIKKHGPYRYTYHTRNTPTIGVICERQYEGRVDEFVKMLRDGYPDELWIGGQNPFGGGLIRKFQLSDARIVVETCPDDSAAAYRAAAIRLLQRHQDRPLDLALVQVREEHKQRFGDQSPYYVSKAVLMSAGVPTQSIRIEVIEQTDSSVAYILNNLALACYAKLEGTPWVLATREPATHEIVIGIGTADVAQQRGGDRTRYFGITTMFQGDGRYLMSDLTRETVVEDYTKALIESLAAALNHVREDNRWQSGDKIRLVCHAYKRLKNCEVDAIKHIVRVLLDEQFDVQFAFLDISQSHPYYLFAPNQPGVAYGRVQAQRVKGKGIPARGTALQLDERRALLHLAGPKDVKTDAHGLPQPLLIELHGDSDFSDLTYLVRQVLHFTHMSWRTFFLATAPITILYSQRIADLLGHLNAVSDWSGSVPVLNTLRGRRWFL
jgi:hypothetical protein